ncbi:hypothetical protein Tco_0496065 [Tanacetum coccineum]
MKTYLSSATNQAIKKASIEHLTSSALSSESCGPGSPSIIDFPSNYKLRSSDRIQMHLLVMIEIGLLKTSRGVCEIGIQYKIHSHQEEDTEVIGRCGAEAITRRESTVERCCRAERVDRSRERTCERGIMRNVQERTVGNVIVKWNRANRPCFTDPWDGGHNRAQKTNSKGYADIHVAHD